MGGKVLLLGFGMQGKAAFYDLLKCEDIKSITVVDTNPTIETNIKKIIKNKNKNIFVKILSMADEEEVFNLMKNSDVVIDLLPAKFTFKAVKMAAEAGVSLVSAMYFHDAGEEDSVKIKQRKDELEEIDKMAREKGITLLSEFGLDPGLDLVIGKKALEEFDEVHDFYSYGAGFPEKTAANNPLKYKFTWSIAGVMLSYLRPAIIIKDGKNISIPSCEMFAKENMHLLKIEELGGTLECFPNGNAAHYAEVMGIKNTVRNMGRYICRWDGTGIYWEKMAKCGFLSKEPIDVNGVKVVPYEFCSSLLGSQKQFFYSENERDVGLIRMDVKGLKNGKEKHVIYQAIDYRDLDTGFTAMSRTTGFTTAVGAELILQGKINKTGIISPLDVDYEYVAEEMKKRGITIKVYSIKCGTL